MHPSLSGVLCSSRLFPLKVYVDLKRFIEAVGDLSDPHCQIQLHQFPFAQLLFEPVHQGFRDTHVLRQFFGIGDDQFLQVIIDRTRLIPVELLDLVRC